MFLSPWTLCYNQGSIVLGFLTKAKINSHATGQIINQLTICVFSCSVYTEPL